MVERNRLRAEFPKLVYFGHHKCASQYIKDILYSVASEAGLRVTPDGHRWDLSTQDDMTENHDIIIWENYTPERMDPNRFVFVGFHVIRDPRDILISQYFSHKDSHLSAPWLTAERAVLRRLSFAGGIDYLIEESMLFEELMSTLLCWDFCDERVYEARFEDLTRNPFAVFHAALSFCKIDISNKALRDILSRHTFRRMKAKNSQHYRSGKIGQWMQLLTNSQVVKFQQRFGQVLDHTGYTSGQ